MRPSQRERVYERIDKERLRQRELGHESWTLASEPQRALAVLVEEVGEVARAQLEHGGWSLEMAAEVEQVAAVAVRWLEEMEIKP